MPKIAEIEDTPNPNAMKFILKEPLTWGITRSYDNAEQAQDDPLAAALFDIEHVTNVFYVDHWITVTQDGEADWQESAARQSPIRSAPRRRRTSSRPPLWRSRAPRWPSLSPEDQTAPRPINELLDEQIRPYLQSDGGDLYVLGLEGNSSPCITRARAAAVRVRCRARCRASRAW